MGQADNRASQAVEGHRKAHERQGSPFKGVHHLVLNTDDIKTTIDFYSGILHMPLIHALRVPPGISRGNPPFERLRHYFFDMGNDNMLAFFELPKGEKDQADRDGVAAMQHVSFSTTPQEAEKLLKRLDAAKIQRAGPLEAAPGCWSIYFYDPHGVRLEVSYQPEQGDEQRNVDHFRQSREGMLKELRTVSDDQAWLDRVMAHLED
ncbi:VOC family protein [Novosphingobium pentaromativorans]|uniref:VOC domain-containing protein n=2 Tax=Novosphingobium pentaromativorans TaxID=205844 RepID=G6EGI7_9SPHN|nr:VOC family protein [Novosphingobium pentaromativorans]AIT82180.1 hypothetical protein JI59_21905 [Novosphingobium pentaromativorans US6-1]EHJ59534.1 hypothetical protein NSU_3417 [Novosphingobium pentaromativorans US6-1]